MKKEAMRISFIVPASPHMVYSAWIDSGQHSAFTGSKATIVSEVGGKFMAGDGYVMGKLAVLDLGRRIVQSWRTTEFPKNHPDSRLEIHFESVPDGTRVTILHSEIPEGQAERYRAGWNEFYAVPMRTYFGKMAQISDKTSAARLAAMAANPPVEEDEPEEEEEEAPAVRPAPKKDKSGKTSAPPPPPAKGKSLPPPAPKAGKSVPPPAKAGKSMPPPAKGKSVPPPASKHASAGKGKEPAKSLKDDKKAAKHDKSKKAEPEKKKKKR